MIRQHNDDPHPVTSELLDRTPPNDPEAERGVIASVLLKADVMDDLTLKPDDFYADANQRLYRTFLSMRDRLEQIDIVTVARRLMDSGEIEAIGGAAYLHGLFNGTYLVAHAQTYAEIVSRFAKYRRIALAGLDLVRDGYSATDAPEEILARVEASLTDIETGEYHGEPRTIGELIVDELIRIEEIRSNKRKAGLLTGLGAFDEEIGGLFPGELVVLAARPGVGKTALACQIAKQIATSGRAVYFVSLEMSGGELTTRLLCSVSGVNNRLIRTARITDDDMRRLREAAKELHQIRLIVHDRPGMSVADIRRAARKIKPHSLSVVMVDYLQIITPADRKIPRHEQVGVMTGELKRLARELEIPVVCLTQLSRDAEKEDRPRFGHLRESGSIEQDADVVAFLKRPVKWPVAEGETEPDAATEAGQKILHTQAALIVDKNRNGETGTYRLRWIGSETRFECPQIYKPHAEFNQYGGNEDF